MTINSVMPRYVTTVILWILILSPGIGLISSARYGIRVEQVLILLFVSLLPVLIIYRINKKFPKHFILLLSPFLALLISLLSSDISAAIGPYAGIARFTGFGVLGYLLTKESNFSNLIAHIQVSCFILLCLALLQHMQFMGIGNVFYYLYPGTNYELYFAIPNVTFGIGEALARYLIFGLMALFFLEKRLKFKLFLIPVYLYYFYISQAFGVLFGIIYFLCLLPFHKRRSLIFWLSVLLVVFAVLFVLIFFDQVIMRDDLLSNNLIIRLTDTWLTPITVWLLSIYNMFFGVGLHIPYGDSGFTAPLAQMGIIGISLLYLPLAYFMFYMRDVKLSYVKYLWFVILILTVSNVTYQAFSVSKQADIFWFIFGSVLKMIDIHNKNTMSNQRPGTELHMLGGNKWREATPLLGINHNGGLPATMRKREGVEPGG
jgi:hypothetical protein